MALDSSSDVMVHPQEDRAGLPGFTRPRMVARLSTITVLAVAGAASLALYALMADAGDLRGQLGLYLAIQSALFVRYAGSGLFLARPDLSRGSRSREGPAEGEPAEVPSQFQERRTPKRRGIWAIVLVFVLGALFRL